MKIVILFLCIYIGILSGVSFTIGDVSFLEDCERHCVLLKMGKTLFVTKYLFFLIATRILVFCGAELNNLEKSVLW